MEWLAIAGGILVLVASVAVVRWGMGKTHENIYDETTSRVPDPVATADVGDKMSGGSG